MITLSFAATTISLGWRGRSITPARTAELASSIGAAALLVFAAALPNDTGRADGNARQDRAPIPITAPSENVFGAYLGAPYHYPSDFHLHQEGRHDLTIKHVDWYTHPFENPLYYGARLQHWLDGGRFGTMVDFTHSKAYAPMKDVKTFEGTLDGKPVPDQAKVQDFFDKLEFSHGHNMLTLNGLMRLASFGSFTPYAGLGAGISLPHSELHLLTDPARTYEYQYTGPIAQALFGVELRLKTGSIFIEYKFTIADYLAPLTHRDGSWLPIDMWRQFSRWWSGEQPPGRLGFNAVDEPSGDRRLPRALQTGVSAVLSSFINGSSKCTRSSALRARAPSASSGC